VDLVAIATVAAGATEPRSWLRPPTSGSTTSRSPDGLRSKTGSSRPAGAHVVDVSFFVDGDEHPAILAQATMRVMTE
jgi:hypothetical protein